MRTAKSKLTSVVIVQPVWCHRCYIRIAPYDLRTVFQGKDYHRDCFLKLRHQGAKVAKN